MVKRVTAAEARIILTKYFGDDVILFDVPTRSWSVDNGQYQAIFADYKGMKGYEPLLAVEVFDRKLDRQVERFNII